MPLPQVRRFSRYLGGSSANMAVGLARLGARVGIVSCLGDDSLSRFLMDFLQAENVDTSPRQYGPRLSAVALPDRGIPARPVPAGVLSPRCRRYQARRDARRPGLRRIRPYVRHQRHVAVRLALARIHLSRHGARQSRRMPRGVGRGLPFHVVEKPGGSRAGHAPGAAVRRCPHRQSVGIEAGRRRGRSGRSHRGSCRRRACPCWFPNWESRARASGPAAIRSTCRPIRWTSCTTIGAGDGFASGFLYAMLQELPVIECLHYGNAAAAIVVSRLSCSEAMPVLAEVEEMMRQQRKA